MNEKHDAPVKIYFDGGCRPNPGAMETAAVLRGVAHFRRDLGDGSNEDAEWLALLHALELAASRDETDLILIGDSLSVIRQARGVQRGDCDRIARYRALARGFARVRLRHVGRSQNLAGIALDKARRGR
ncbi:MULTISPECIES: reverse transcriptase-like protein [unclassified Sphingomonas]|uniref:reverse transcriptase-like protein n=1 Tax=unclassified Sphingomonas TaxID=196159 RepID=UPI000B2B17BA|nr:MULTISPECIES: reverse transcriptase-like protein [unclassified Sphingomonas]